VMSVEEGLERNLIETNLDLKRVAQCHVAVFQHFPMKFPNLGFTSNVFVFDICFMFAMNLG